MDTWIEKINTKQIKKLRTCLKSLLCNNKDMIKKKWFKLSLLIVISNDDKKADLWNVWKPKYKVAIEIDEHNHSDRNQKYEIQREKYIKNKLGCKIIRINPDDNNFSVIELLADITKLLIM